MRQLGVRGRVVLPFALVMAVILAVAGVSILSGVDDQLTDGVDNSLETRAAAVARLLVERGGPEPGLTAGLDDPGESFTQILDPDRRVVLASDGLPPEPLLRGEEAIEDAAEGTNVTLQGVDVEDDEPGDEEYDREALEETAPEPFEDDRARLLARGVDVAGTRYTVIVGDTLEDRVDAQQALTRVLLIAMPLSLLAACLVGFVAIGAALRPVERMRQQASGISDRSLSARLELPGSRDELRRLAETLNAMLERLESALERERSFASDASHELRTPLAILRGELELALRGERSADELRAAIASALEETSRLGELADGLLLLARSDHGQLAAARESVDLVDVARRASERLGVSIDASAAASGGLSLSGDAQRLEQAVGNLVENALRHGEAPVEVSVGRVDDRLLEVVVVDHGPGLPTEFAPRAFERFARADAARTTEGTGLGLSIAQAVARAHGGDVTLAAQPGGGTLARLTVLSSTST